MAAIASHFGVNPIYVNHQANILGRAYNMVREQTLGNRNGQVDVDGINRATRAGRPMIERFRESAWRDLEAEAAAPPPAPAPAPTNPPAAGRQRQARERQPQQQTPAQAARADLLRIVTEGNMPFMTPEQVARTAIRHGANPIAVRFAYNQIQQSLRMIRDHVAQNAGITPQQVHAVSRVGLDAAQRLIDHVRSRPMDVADYVLGALGHGPTTPGQRSARVRLTPEQRAERDQQRQADRETRQQAREEARQARDEQRRQAAEERRQRLNDQRSRTRRGAREEDTPERRELRAVGAKKPPKNEDDTAFRARTGLLPSASDREAYNKVLGGVSRADLEKVFGGANHTYQINDIQARGNKVRVTGILMDRDGREIGDLTRSFERLADGGIHVHHDYMSLRGRAQGGGYAAEVYRRGFALYAGLGGNKASSYVSILANIDVGKYAWARQGFDFMDPGEAASYRRRLKDWLQSKGKTISDDQLNRLNHTWDFALLNDGNRYEAPTNREQVHLGKAFMLSQGSWGAKRKIYDDGQDTGWRVAMEYEAQRKNRQPTEPQQANATTQARQPAASATTAGTRTTSATANRPAGAFRHNTNNGGRVLTDLPRMGETVEWSANNGSTGRGEVLERGVGWVRVRSGYTGREYRLDLRHINGKEQAVPIPGTGDLARTGTR